MIRAPPPLGAHERGLKSVSRTIGRDDRPGPAIALYIANELLAEKVAFADDNTSYGEASRKRSREIPPGREGSRREP